MEPQDWKAEKPMIVNNVGSLRVDISEFYVGDDPKPIHTVIAQQTTEPLILFTSVAEQNQFKGIIHTMGSLEIEGDLEMTGSIFTKGVIRSTKGTVNIFKSSDMIFTIPFEDISLQRQLLDYFNITSFYKIKDSKVIGSDNMNALFGRPSLFLMALQWNRQHFS